MGDAAFTPSLPRSRLFEVFGKAFPIPAHSGLRAGQRDFAGGSLKWEDAEINLISRYGLASLEQLAESPQAAPTPGWLAVRWREIAAIQERRLL